MFELAKAAAAIARDGGRRGGPPGRRRRIGRSDRGAVRAARRAHPRRRGRRLPRADRGSRRRWRRCRVDRDDVGSRRGARRCHRGRSRSGMPYTATCSFDTAGRTMMGLPPGDLGRVFEGLPIAPVGLRRQLRRRRAGHPRVAVGDDRSRSRGGDDLQGQLRSPPLRGHRDRLLRHPGADGPLCRAGRRRRGAHRRRLLRDVAGAPRGDARGDRSARCRRPPGPSTRSSPSVGPLTNTPPREIGERGVRARSGRRSSRQP